MEELHSQIYVRSSSAVLEGFQKIESGGGGGGASSGPRPGHDSQSAYLRQQMMRSSDPDSSPMSTEMMALRRLMDVDVSSLVASRPTVASGMAEPDADPIVFTSILVESLSNLHRLQDAVELLKSRVRPGLIGFIQRATQHVADSACIDDSPFSSPPAQPQLLLELLELIFRHSRVVAQAHAVVVAHMTRTKVVVVNIVNINNNNDNSRFPSMLYFHYRVNSSRLRWSPTAQSTGMLFNS